MKLSLSIPVALFAVLAFAGCKDKGAATGDKPAATGDKPAAAGDKPADKPAATGGKVASCTSVKTGSCREYNEDNLAMGSDGLAKLCTIVDAAAVFAMVPCSTDKLVGTCTTPEGKDFYYPAFPMTPDELDNSCKTGHPAGTFARAK